MRFNPPPGWPPPPEGFTPDPSWRPDPSWPPAPPGWQLWVPEEPGDASSTGLTPGYIGYAPAPAGSQWAGWAPQALPPSATTNGMAIAGFVLGLLGFFGITAIIGIVLGSVALSNVRRTAQGGKGLAIAGIVLSGCWLAFFLILIVIGAVVGGTSGSSTG